jgi:nucleotide-binding universal stress UspA family protein
MKHILFPTDFSACANNALEHACQIAKHFKASITLLHAYPIPIAASDVPTELIISAHFKEDAEKSMHQLLTELQARHSDIFFQSVIAAGDPPTEINYYLKENACDIVIMGTTGAGGLKRLTVGSTASHVINRAHVPVLIIPADKAYTEIKHIVISSTFNETEIAHIKSIYEWYQAFHCRISILSVDDVTTYQDDVTPQQRESFMQALNNALPGVKTDLILIKGVDVSTSIIDYVAHHEVDLLVTVHQHRGFFAQLLFPSISKEIAFHPPVPLLVFNQFK